MPCELIFIFYADAFDVGELDFGFVACAGCKGARAPAAQPITRARAALTRACARGWWRAACGLFGDARAGGGSGQAAAGSRFVAKSGPERPQGGRRARRGDALAAVAAVTPLAAVAAAVAVRGAAWRGAWARGRAFKGSVAASKGSVAPREGEGGIRRFSGFPKNTRNPLKPFYIQLTVCL